MPAFEIGFLELPHLKDMLQYFPFVRREFVLALSRLCFEFCGSDQITDLVLGYKLLVWSVDNEMR